MAIIIKLFEMALLPCRFFLQRSLKFVLAAFLSVATFYPLEKLYAADTCSTLFSPKISNIIQFGNASRLHDSLPKKMQVLVWNAYKGAKRNFLSDFQNISASANLILLQESITAQSFQAGLLAANNNSTWTQTISFQRRLGDFTGVATGSTAKPIKELYLRSNYVEPIVKTPKSMLITEYKVTDLPQNLLVVNVHAINFVANRKFFAQVDQIVEAVKKHQGPMLIAGDFNTWNNGRLIYLKNSFNNLGLQIVNENQSGKLDHLFARGLTLKTVYDLKHIRSSDHKPILLDFDITLTP